MALENYLNNRTGQIKDVQSSRVALHVIYHSESCMVELLSLQPAGLLSNFRSTMLSL